MDRSEVIKRKAALTELIQKSIQKFELETGLVVDDIGINKMDVSTVGDPKQTFLKSVQIRTLEDTKWSY